MYFDAVHRSEFCNLNSRNLVYRISCMPLYVHVDILVSGIYKTLSWKYGKPSCGCLGCKTYCGVPHRNTYKQTQEMLFLQLPLNSVCISSNNTVSINDQYKMQIISIQIYNKVKELNNNIIKVHMRSRLLITLAPPKMEM